MFKRFTVLDLFHEHEDLDKGLWTSCDEELPKEHASIFKVRLKNGDEVSAYFCSDKCLPLFLTNKDADKLACYWWSKNDRMPLHTVTHWRNKNYG